MGDIPSAHHDSWPRYGGQRAPLTATVLNAVPAHRTGVASGVNNAVASVASLLAVALFGAIALSEFDRALDRNMTSITASPEVRRLVENAHGKFVTPPIAAGFATAYRRVAEKVIKTSLAQSIRIAMLVAALLALGAALCAALTIPRGSVPSISDLTLTTRSRKLPR